jgi:hypothetical protein
MITARHYQQRESRQQRHAPGRGTIVPLPDLLVGTAEKLDGVVLPDALPAFDLPHLTPEQLADIDKGPGRVATPVELERFADASQLNNFALYFAAEGSIAGVIYQRIRCNRRFAIIYPDFATKLRANYLVLRDSRVTSPQKERILMHAYELMAGLVDRDDPGVVDSLGRVCGRYLWQ